MSSNFFSSRGRELLAGRTDNGLLVVISRGQNETTSAVQLPSELVHRCRLVRHEYQRVNAYHRIGRFVLEPFSSNEPTHAPLEPCSKHRDTALAGRAASGERRWQAAVFLRQMHHSETSG